MPKIDPEKVQIEEGDGRGINAGMGAYVARLLSDTGGLTQFGAFIETLAPKSFSSHRHWHENEDEFIYMLQGEVMLIDNTGPKKLREGMAAAFPAGDANGHQLHNQSSTPVTYLVVGTRARDDVVHYSDIDRLYRRKDGVVTRSKRDGTPIRTAPTGDAT